MSWVVVLIGFVFVFGIFSLLMDTILDTRSYYKAISTPLYQEHRKVKSEDNIIYSIDLTDSEETYTVL